MTLRMMVVIAGCILSSSALEARSPIRAPGPQAGSVSVCSRYGNGCYAAPVRYGRYGLEMRLKGGTWIDCKGSCKDTLREETIDFWDTQRERGKR
jgi:hypothetical protein